MESTPLQTAVAEQFKKMQGHTLVKVQVDKDLLWDTYLKSFPEEANPMYKERTEHDCNACKSFIRQAGAMVAIVEGKRQTLWDVQVGGEYQPVVDALAKMVKEAPIDNIFLHTEPSIGVDENKQILEDGSVITWKHLHIKLPKAMIVKKDMIGVIEHGKRTSAEVFKRALETLTQDSVDTVLDLIKQNSLYRGEEHKFVVTEFNKVKQQYDKFTGDKDLFAWDKSQTVVPSVSGIRNTVIGSLLIDLSEGMDLEKAVASFESKVAPTNYKRPTALVSKAMVEKAKQKVEELGYTSALQRRYANLEDISINDILYADRNAKKRISDVFDEVAANTPTNTKKMNKVESMDIQDFITKVVPTATSIEVMFDNKHMGNLVSLVAPVDPNAKQMFKWPNNFTWSYNGDLTDSNMKEKIKNAGGEVNGDLRCSIEWYNRDDLDLHMYEPKDYHIGFHNKRIKSKSGGVLDVDANGGDGIMPQPVENIIYANKREMAEGVYMLQVVQYSKREKTNVGFAAEIEFGGEVFRFEYTQDIIHKGHVNIAEIEYSKKNGFKILKSIPSTKSVKQVWGLNTENFHPVSVIMHSPNHWENTGSGVGNKHYFFMMHDCVNDGNARGFYNEFLTPELDQERKVLEIVGSKMRTAETDNQLSGLGFSSTKADEILVKVGGSFDRFIKVTFKGGNR